MRKRALVGVVVAWCAIAGAASAQGAVFYQPQDVLSNVNGFSFDGSTLAAIPPQDLDFNAQSRWAAGDIDGDGAPDVVTMLNGFFSFYRFDPVARTWQSFEGGSVDLFVDGRLVLGDVDGDGTDEITTCGRSRPSHSRSST